VLLLISWNNIKTTWSVLAFVPAQLQDYYKGHNIAYQELMVAKSKVETRNSVCGDKPREQ
jgi:hypothetical protein